MSWRELRTFVRHVPQESAYGHSVLGEAAGWQVAEHLLAILNNQFTRANSDKQVPDSKLIQLPKPQTEVRPTAKPGGLAELNALYGG